MAAIIAGLAVAAWADDPIQFNRDVRPILSEACFACHGPDANTREADLRLDVEAEAKASAIVVGDPEASELIARIISDAPELRMPPMESGHELTTGQIELLQRWVAQGAPYEGHWAFIAPQRPPLPNVEDDAVNLTPIDRFVRARLAEEGLSPSTLADRRESIRRVTFDLTGLPPTPADVEAFLSDESPAAYEQVVDRLLESPRYGEHMTRYWLDAARYADTNGYQYDLERDQWVWRDWLIQAFNSNMPFDQFTIEQLAGDLLPNATDQQRLATAFHRNHPITIEGGVIDEEYRTEYVIDRVVTTSTVWLGLTMTCGRCHDHKYDPVSQREFYQFFAFFNQVPERGLNGFDPKLKVASPLRAGEIATAREQLAEARSRWQSELSNYANELAAWEEQVADEVTNRWRVIEPPSVTSQGGAKFVPQPDRSLLVTGENPVTDVYEIHLAVDRPIHAIRLEALTHESFVSGGTGRSANANFVLSEFEVAVTEEEASSDYEPVKIAAATADYSQADYPIEQSIDGKIDRTGWAVDGNTKRENRLAVFTFAEPIEPQATGVVRIRLHFQWGGSHTIGRFRIAVAERPLVEVPAEVAAIVEAAPAQRKPDQTGQLNEYLAERVGSVELKSRLEELGRLRVRLAELENAPATMVMAERPNPRQTHVLFRGEYDKPRDEVSPATPNALPPMSPDLPRNRLGLARWLISREHPLTARVTVNRLWQQLFGTGLVKTAEDFGSQGEWPSHPELLDWLAVEFMDSGWNVKAILKQIVMSQTYRQSGRVSPELLALDPENRLLARGPRMRLDAEVIRDSALAAAGLLGETLGGPSVFPYHPPGLWQEINNRPGYSRTYQQDSGNKLYRRSLYTFWKRTVPPPSMAAFDAPEREFCIVRRSRTNTPLQAFVLLHDPQFVEAARHLALRMLTEAGPATEQRLAHGFKLCFARDPSPDEQDILQHIVIERQEQYQQDGAAAEQVISVGDSPAPDGVGPAELAAWTTVARTMMNLSEFVTKP